MLFHSQMSQQRFSPSTATQARPASHVASDVHTCPQSVVSAHTGAPDTSARHTVRLPLQSDGPHSVPDGDGEQGRSEEHTSELQSPCNLVCRLLLEKKKHMDMS